jgi:hypothetical protein
VCTKIVSVLLIKIDNIRENGFCDFDWDNVIKTIINFHKHLYILITRILVFVYE